MEFKLFYQGELLSNDNAEGKHKVRREFHRQLKALWELPPLSYHPDWGLGGSKLRPKDKTRDERFAFLISRELDMYAGLRIDILLPRNTSFKDIDNKVKTLGDALSVPDPPADPAAHVEPRTR